MLTIEQLKKAIHRQRLKKTDIALLCLATAGGKGVLTRVIKELAIECGVKDAKRTNFFPHLAASGKAFMGTVGWELTEDGWKYTKKLADLELSTTPVATEAQTLRSYLPKIKNEDARDFITEAVECAEHSLLRSAVVLSWVGAMAILHDVIVNGYLSSFNAEALKRDAKWKAATKSDDLGKIKEATFLEIAVAISLIGKNVKQELEGCLKLRNSCGHPTSLKIGAHAVATHLEILTLNVYAVFAQ
jgi:hypothetical protein